MKARLETEVGDLEDLPGPFVLSIFACITMSFPALE